jgi:membrane protein
MQRLREFVELLRMAAQGWWQDRVPRMGASLAYYTLFALAPILLVAITIASVLFDPGQVRHDVMEQIEGLLGAQGAATALALLEGASPARTGILVTIVGVVTLMITATGAMLELQASLNDIWRVKQDPQAGLGEVLSDRLRALAIIVGIGFLLLVSLLASAVLASAGRWLGRTWGLSPAVLVAVNVVVSLALVTLLFALIFRVLPDVQLRWRDVWKSAVVTAVLFTIGKELIGIYLGRSSISSSYGSAASAIVLLLWVYYFAQIVLFGAEFARAETERALGGRVPARGPARKDASRRRRRR